MNKIKVVSTFFLALVLSVTFSGSAQANDVVFCVSKTSRIVTFPAYGVCKSDQIVLRLPNNSSGSTELPTIKNHTDTVKSEPKQVQKVSVPNVLGMQQLQAQQTLSALKLKVQIKAKDKRGKVIQVLPNVGTQVAAGTVVVLVIG
jgi:acetyl/propionyl-CoA carboxylase alpha subunit